MKKIIIITILTLLPFLNGCRPEEEVLTESNLDVSTAELTDLDTWLNNTFTIPYNIDVRYRWSENVVDFNRFLIPPKTSNVQPTMEALKTVWIDTYTEVAGENFIKQISPKELILIGGPNVNTDGSSTLGFAEQGSRVALFEIDQIDLNDQNDVVRFVSVIQHEYTHILNQLVPFDEVTYGNITPADYTGQWQQRSNAQARELGFITSYAASNVIEDFAEMVNIILSYNNTDYNAIIDGITSDKAKADIRRKEQIVANYFQAEFGIDLYELQRVAAENVQRVIN